MKEYDVDSKLDFWKKWGKKKKGKSKNSLKCLKECHKYYFDRNIFFLLSDR